VKGFHGHARRGVNAAVVEVDNSSVYVKGLLDMKPEIFVPGDFLRGQVFNLAKLRSQRENYFLIVNLIAQMHGLHSLL
jgi:hypothetical protein